MWKGEGWEGGVFGVTLGGGGWIQGTLCISEGFVFGFEYVSGASHAKSFASVRIVDGNTLANRS